MTAIDRFVFTPEGLGAKRVSIMRWSGHVGVHGLASGDFDGDGKLDLLVTDEVTGQREAVILLGDGKGGFIKARIEGLRLDENNLYDVKVADVNHEGRPDVLLM